MGTLLRSCFWWLRDAGGDVQALREWAAGRGLDENLQHHRPWDGKVMDWRQIPEEAQWYTAFCRCPQCAEGEGRHFYGLTIPVFRGAHVSEPEGCCLKRAFVPLLDRPCRQFPPEKPNQRVHLKVHGNAYSAFMHCLCLCLCLCLNTGRALLQTTVCSPGGGR